jgi:hypothetical protein
LVEISALQEGSASAPTISDRFHDSDGFSLFSVEIGNGIDFLLLKAVQLESLRNCEFI